MGGLIRMRQVLLDFDGTLTIADTTLLFGTHLARGRRFRRAAVVRLLGYLVLGRAGLTDNTRMKRAFARMFLKGRSEAEIHVLACGFFDRFFDSITDRDMLAILRRHVDAGDAVRLVSANFSRLLAPLEERLSLLPAIATEAAVAGGTFIGDLDGPACHGDEKLRRARASLGSSLENAIAYGNPDDLPLLRHTGEPYLVERLRPTGGRLRRALRILSGRSDRADLHSECRVTRLADTTARVAVG